MRTTCVASVAVALVLAAGARAQERGENPFKDAKVGDYLTYKMTMSIMGKDNEGTMKETVTAKTDKEVILKSETTPGKGKEQTRTIDLTKPYDPIAFFLHEDKDAKFAKSGEGDEKIQVGDKTYECHWVAGKVTSSAGELKNGIDVKMWRSKSVPLSGLVKLEAKTDQFNMRVELTGSGHEK
jgi:hypothetical protein